MHMCFLKCPVLPTVILPCAVHMNNSTGYILGSLYCIVCEVKGECEVKGVCEVKGECEVKGVCSVLDFLPQGKKFETFETKFEMLKHFNSTQMLMITIAENFSMVTLCIIVCWKFLLTAISNRFQALISTSSMTMISSTSVQLALRSLRFILRVSAVKSKMVDSARAGVKILKDLKMIGKNQ